MFVILVSGRNVFKRWGFKDRACVSTHGRSLRGDAMGKPTYLYKLSSTGLSKISNHQVKFYDFFFDFTGLISFWFSPSRCYNVQRHNQGAIFDRVLHWCGSRRSRFSIGQTVSILVRYTDVVHLVMILWIAQTHRQAHSQTHRQSQADGYMYRLKDTHAFQEYIKYTICWIKFMSKHIFK